MIRTCTLLLTALAALGCSSPEPTTPAAPTDPAAAVKAPAAAATAEPAALRSIESPVGTLTRIEDSSLVCMVNDQFMGKPQIPIVAEGNTYYGCCEMCKGRLANDPGVRVGKDPGTGQAVDKSTALIAQDAKGATFYFENEQSFAAYGGSANTL